jgi:molybdopterin synthase sulfur carrier subunit
MRIVYFAWLRERLDKSEEDVELPSSVETIGDVIAWLKTRGEEYELAFDNPKVIRAAIDKTHVRPEAKIAGASEIAFFPPMTGG